MLCIPHTTKGITILTNQLILTIILPNYISIPCSIHSQRQGCHKGNPIALDLIETEFSWCREKPSSSICTLALADKVDSLHLQWWQTCKFSTICSGIKSLHTASQGSDTIFWVIGDDSVGYVGDGGGGWRENAIWGNSLFCVDVEQCVLTGCGQEKHSDCNMYIK